MHKLSTKKHGFISIIGETNSGKSTLVNALVKDKVSIVSHKVQTTRNQILGIYNDSNTQLIFIDTPGLFLPKQKLDTFIIRYAYSSLSEANIILLLIDVNKGITPLLKNFFQRLEPFKNKNIIVALNKIDLLNKEEKSKLLEISQTLYKTQYFKEIFMISALKQDGLIKLINYLVNNVDSPEWVFNEEQTSNISLNFWASEITREKIYKYLHQELPYVICVKPLSWVEKSHSIIIKQDIVVTKKSHKKIVIGDNATTIKRISIESKKELEHYLNKKIHLYLFVKVDDKILTKEEHFINKSILSNTK